MLITTQKKSPPYPQNKITNLENQDRRVLLKYYRNDKNGNPTKHRFHSLVKFPFCGK